MNVPELRLASVVLFSLCLSTAACGGGGGGGEGPGPLVAACDPGDYMPTPPAGLGVAGLMDGTWVVLNQTLIADPRNRDPQLSTSRYGLGEQIEFRDGIVYEGPDPDPSGGSGPTGVPGLVTTPEFVCNERDGMLTLYGFGARFSGGGIPPSAVRLAAVFGTTSSTSATAIVVEEQDYPFMTPAPVDRFMVSELTLQKLPGVPLVLEQPGDDEMPQDKVDVGLVGHDADAR